MQTLLTKRRAERDVPRPLMTNDGSDAAPAPERIGHPGQVRHQETRQLWSAMLDPAGLKLELDSNDDRLQAVQRSIEALQAENLRLRKKAIRLARMVADARHRAHHDELTGLPTRRLLLDRCQQALAQAQRQHQQVGFMMLDLNEFKRVNDRYGHEAGDGLLKHVAECLLCCTRRCDTVCRYGGDEFVIMLPGLDSRERMATLATKIHARLAAQYVIRGESVITAISVGVAIYPADGDSFSLLMKQADLSMYLSKSNWTQGEGISRQGNIARC